MKATRMKRRKKKKSTWPKKTRRKNVCAIQTHSLARAFNHKFCSFTRSHAHKQTHAYTRTHSYSLTGRPLLAKEPKSARPSVCLCVCVRACVCGSQPFRFDDSFHFDCVLFEASLAYTHVLSLSSPRMLSAYFYSCVCILGAVYKARNSTCCYYYCFWLLPSQPLHWWCLRAAAAAVAIFIVVIFIIGVSSVYSFSCTTLSHRCKWKMTLPWVRLGPPNEWMNGWTQCASKARNLTYFWWIKCCETPKTIP